METARNAVCPNCHQKVAEDLWTDEYKTKWDKKAKEMRG
jgi:hypothetical protein